MLYFEQGRIINMKLLWKIFLEELEFKRQIAHLIFGLCYAVAYTLGFMTVTNSLLLLAGALCLSLWLRKRRTFVDKIVLMLEREKHLLDLPLRGLLFFILGSTLTIYFFDFIPALSGILVLSVADSIGTLYGKYLGVAKIRWNPDKHMEGPILGGLVAGIMLMSIVPAPIAFTAAYVGAFIDTFTIKIFRFEIDDNLLIPLASALVVMLMG